MRKLSLLVSLVIPSALVYGQLESNTITVTASRPTALQADLAVFGVTVQSGLTTNLNDVIAALQGAGITQSNFQSVSTVQQFALNPPSSMLQWVFSLSVPFSKMKDTVALLTNLEASITQNNSGLTLSFAVEGTQVSTQALQSQACVVSDLITQAQTQAQTIAGAAGLFVGRILAMSGNTEIVVPNNAPVVPGLVGLVLSPSISVAPPCVVTIKFALFQ
jgi:uncharacterized protein YggE